MRLREQLVLWNQASIKVMDIRHITMRANEELRSYPLPASSFFYTVNGSANIQLDDVMHQANPFYIVHGGKGCCVDIFPTEEAFEYYILYYKASISPRVHQRFGKMLERSNPFLIQYGFAPGHPISLLRSVQLMHKEWEENGELEQFHVKALFHQFVYELLWQIHSQHIPTRKADVVAQAIQYVHRHYADLITMEKLAAMLDSSPRHLSRLFKQHTGSSPVDYVIQIRMDKARELLLSTGANLQEIAESVGYSDSYYFAKMFKKHVGVAPIRYRTENRGKSCPNVPSAVARYDIVQQTSRYYSEYENHYHYKSGGNLSMHDSRTSSVAVTLLLCLTLLLSACSTGTTGSTSLNGSAQSTQAASNHTSETPVAGNADNKQSTGTAEQPKTKIVSTVKGDVEVPVNPKRVVVLYLLGDVLAFGVDPVGISDVYKGAAFESELAGIQSLGEWFQPSPEAVLALNPDLIIVPSEETYAMLNQIAPTVYLPYEQMSLEERLKKLGEALGKEGGQSQALLDNFYAKVVQSKQKLKEAGILDKTVSIMEGGEGNMGVISSKQYGRGSQIIYEYLGMKAPAIIQKEIDKNGEKPATLLPASMEVLHGFSGDYIFRSAYEGMEDLSDNKIWNSIPAVKEGRLIDISFGLSYYNDIYSLDKQLDYIVNSLLEAAKAK
ncbi:AraC family transcriptional regulator [Paenibacillus profundus]|uniref:AraC family transcriptional regulator n=1 Tax=Paenibacillus profundus TaxID=1173085 RepID=A0ABS8YNY0_9BACL|nr:AraC family transcriptional regulator [Paenibacillus profundus]MCE5172977.1 AraC family transcriptional regulator [Paenibacillus profundus]